MRHRSRRDFVKLAGGLAMATAFPFPKPSFAGMWSQIFGGLSRDMPPITANDDFYITSYRMPPIIRKDNWSLTIKGLVNNPMTLNYPALLAKPTRSEIVTLECVGNGIAGESIGTAEWEGLSLKTLLDEAGVQSNAYDVVFRAADGYSDSITLDRAMRDDVLIAHRMNGVTLPQGHGYPARIIAPGIYGMKNVQWLTEIELVPHDYHGYYQKQGWSDDATVKTMTWINDPQDGDTLSVGQTKMIRGFAFAGDRGIRHVKLKWNEDPHWRKVTLSPAQSPYSWVFWSFPWEITQKGDHRISARATDGTGSMQTLLEEKPFPAGAAGLHEVIVGVTG